jgi:hypothetical protein
MYYSLNAVILNSNAQCRWVPPRTTHRVPSPHQLLYPPFLNDSVRRRAGLRLMEQCHCLVSRVAAWRTGRLRILPPRRRPTPRLSII